MNRGRGLNETQMRALEDMIDATSVEDLITGVEVVCREKADHIRAEWQDEALAKDWEAVARVLSKVVLP